MAYKYSICHPDKREIEYSDRLLSAEQVKDFALNYAWKTELQKMDDLAERAEYNPSVGFTNQTNKFSLELTAEGDPKDFSFSLWYNRPVRKKILFGLLGGRTAFDVIDKAFTNAEAFALLDLFLAENYDAIEQAMKD